MICRDSDRRRRASEGGGDRKKCENSIRHFDGAKAERAKIPKYT